MSSLSNPSGAIDSKVRQAITSLNTKKMGGDTSDEMDTVQQKNIFNKTHIMNIGSSSMDPQRDWMFMLYIRDIRGSYWTDVGASAANAFDSLTKNNAGMASGSVKSAMYQQQQNMIQSTYTDSTGTSPQQELIYRCDSVTLPSRSVEKAEGRFMGAKANYPTNINYEGNLSVVFEEGEDQFILRQFNSWMNKIDEWAITSYDSTEPSTEGTSKRMSKNSSSEYVGAPEIWNSSLAHNLKTDIELFMFKYSGEDVGYKIKFYGCYPSTIGNSNWAYSSAATVKYTVSFEFDYFKVEYIKSALNPSISSGNTTSSTANVNTLAPASLAGNMLQQTTNSSYLEISKEIIDKSYGLINSGNISIGPLKDIIESPTKDKLIQAGNLASSLNEKLQIVPKDAVKSITDGINTVGDIIESPSKPINLLKDIKSIIPEIPKSTNAIFTQMSKDKVNASKSLVSNLLSKINTKK